MKTDKYQGQGGDFEVDRASGERRRKGEAPKSEPEGGGARDKDGKRIQEKPAPVESAVPPAPERAPWQGEPEVQQPKKRGA